jgi:CCR4-NOT transcription complex subunit 10
MSSNDGTKKKTNMELAIKAEGHYNAGQYGPALDILHRIEKSITDREDPRLLHNLRLTESAVKGFSNVATLKEGLNSVKRKIRAKQWSKQNDTNQAEESADVLGDVSDSLSLLRDADTDCTILLYNLAALHLESKEYGAARSILEHLFRNIEPVDETVAIYACLLFLDALVHCHRGALLSETERSAFSTQTEEVLAYLEKLSQSSGRKETTSTDLEFRIHLYRARALLMCHQLKASKKEIKSALEIFQRSKSEGSSKSASDKVRNESALYLKANFEYLRQNYRKALKLLSSCHSSGSGEGADAAMSALTKQGPMYFNNVGCVHHKMGKYHAALSFFSKALKQIEAGEVGPIGVAEEVRYNCGVELLLMGNPEKAFECFQASASLLYSRPLLWLRMAECCIARYCVTKTDPDQQSSSWVKVGETTQRRLILAADHKDNKWKGEKNELSKCNLLEAKKCLEKTLFLVNGMAAAAAKEEAAAEGVLLFATKKATDKESNGAAASQGAEEKAEVPGSSTSIETAAYLKLAFVHLCLDEPAAAASYASKLTSTGTGIPTHILVLGKQYAAEALCTLNRPLEALELISPDHQPPTQEAVDDVAAHIGSPVAECGQFSMKPMPGSVICPRHPSHMKAALHANLAATFAVQSVPDSLKKAEKCARNAVAACPASQHAHRMLVYVLLKSGNVSEACEWLKMYRTAVDIWA